jgi:Protein of unknown function (DUF3572)
MAKRVASSRATAESVGVAALSFLADDSERFSRFVSLTGIGPEKIRAAAAEPGFLAGVLDHLMADESLLRTFAAERGFDPLEVVDARSVLTGPGWEREVP